MPGFKKPTNERIVDLRKTTSAQQPETQPKPADQTETLREADVLLAWSAPEFVKYKKEPHWLLSLALVVIALVGYFLLTRNILGALVTLVASFLVYSYSIREPREVRFEILPFGIAVGEHKFYEFERLKSFWILYAPPDLKEVVIRTKATFSPYLNLPLGNTNPVDARNILLKFLPEKEEYEPLPNRLARKLRF